MIQGFFMATTENVLEKLEKILKYMQKKRREKGKRKWRREFCQIFWSEHFGNHFFGLFYKIPGNEVPQGKKRGVPRLRILLDPLSLLSNLVHSMKFFMFVEKSF